ncbi:MAG TPA: YceI family protein [Ferruginibacter sp.]|nr:YceI family protein [Ferruginibacter sp.]
MKKNIFIAMLFFSVATYAQTWKNDKDHSRLSFEVTHLMISTVTGSINTFQCTITSSKADFSDAVFELTAEAGSIDTKVPERDTQLKSPDFFDVAKYPLITFKSSSIKKIVKNKYMLTGNLTMHGITRMVTADFIYKGQVINPATKNTTAGFQVTAILKRSDYKLGMSFPVEIIKDQVLVVADGEFIRQ